LPYLERYGLGGFENRYPSALSGGMRQRAALLRTLLIDTDIILLDEPFGALDAQTKQRMQEWLLTLWADFGKTVIFVTHDVEEAVFLSDEIYVMAARPGRIVERLAVTMERPRSRALVSTAAFVALKQQCLGLLSDAPVEMAA
jgi:ABC-type nitrate/sulfonate/bicarbonate transport system ATPase subunit